MKSKPCSSCKEVKSAENFCKDKSKKSGLASQCRSCTGRYFKSLPLEARRQRERKANLSKFGITLEQYENMFLAQKGVCAICKNPESDMHRRTGKVQRLAVDHDHTTGKVRGLLCGNCNRGIGGLKDNISLLHSAIKYLGVKNEI